MGNDFEVPIETLRLADGLCLEDDWFAVKQLDRGTFAIGEPAYHQRNWCYLICDAGESLLFDTGSGFRSITELLARHAEGPVTAFPSHMHHDHLGNINAFERVMVADLPILRGIAREDEITPPEAMFLGASEGTLPPTFKVDQWINLDRILKIGSRNLQVLHTPGHSPDSVSLWEPQRYRLYAADFVYCGALYAQTPGACLRDYLQTTAKLIEILPENVEIVCAHGRAENGRDDMPLLGLDDLRDLQRVLEKVLQQGKAKAGEMKINQKMSLIYSVESLAVSNSQLS